MKTAKWVARDAALNIVLALPWMVLITEALMRLGVWVGLDWSAFPLIYGFSVVIVLVVAGQQKHDVLRSRTRVIVTTVVAYVLAVAFVVARLFRWLPPSGL